MYYKVHFSSKKYFFSYFENNESFCPPFFDGVWEIKFEKEKYRILPFNLKYDVFWKENDKPSQNKSHIKQIKVKKKLIQVKEKFT